MCLPLAVISVKLVETLFAGDTFRAGLTESPFSETTGRISGILHHPADCHGTGF